MHYACRVIRKARAAGSAQWSTHATGRSVGAVRQRAMDFLRARLCAARLRRTPRLRGNTPVLLARDAGAAPGSDVLLTLDDDVPPHFEEFIRAL